MPLALQQVATLAFEFISDAVRFPWWWYSAGVARVGRWCWRGFSETRARVSLGVFVRHFFTPMYQDYTIQGRLLSIAMRFVLVFAKLARLGASLVWYLGVLAGWLALFPVALWGVIS